MHRLNRIGSGEHLLSLFTPTPTTVRHLRVNPPLNSLAFKHFSRRRVMETASNKIDDFVHVSEADQISGGDHEILPEIETGSNANNCSYVRKVLPPALARTVVKLTCESVAEGGECDVYLVGTAHVSTESCQEVQAVINFLKPQVVFLELCSSRVALLAPPDLKVPTIREILESWKKSQNIFGLLYGWFLAKVASHLDVFPGAEFRVAYLEAMKYGAKVILGDRNVQITLQRTWAKMPLWHKTKLLSTLLFQAVFLPSPEVLNKALKRMDGDMLTQVIEEIGEQYPTLMETLVHERDLYMSTTLLRTAREHNSVVAVVGRGHVSGIKRNWGRPVDMKKLLVSPSKTKTFTVRKILSTVGITVAGTAIISGIYLSVKK